MRARLAVMASLFCLFGTAAAQVPGPDYSRNPEWFPRVYRPYTVRKVPEVQFRNSASLLDLIRDGKLRISLAQLKSAVKDNNLGILSSNLMISYADTDLLRSRGGGAPRGGAGVQIPSSLFASAIGAGVGGYSGLGSFSGASISGAASQVFGVARGSYDPSISIGFSLDRTVTPLNTIVVSGLPQVGTTSLTLQTRYSQAFTDGASLSVALNTMRQNSDQQFLLYNPDIYSQFSVSFTQQLLNGFGSKIGRRFVEVSKNETKIMKENARLQINTVLAQAENAYWDLVAARDNVRVAERSLEVAQRLLDENRQKEELGAMSGLDVITADSELASRQLDLINARKTLELREVDLKGYISRDLPEILGPVAIEAADILPDPKEGDIPKLGEALSEAMSGRSEILQGEANLLTQDIAVQYGKNLLKPTLLFFANFNSSGLYGNQILTAPNGAVIVLPGGLSQVYHQLSLWRSPEYSVGFSFSINIHNGAARADSFRAKMERQQAETGLQNTRNGVGLEVRKAIIGLVQSKAQVEAAHEAVRLSAETLAAEEAKLQEGASTPYNVILRQRDLMTAEVAEVQARANYAKALVERDRSMGMLEPPSRN